MSEYNKTTNKLHESRLIKLALIGVSILVGIRVASYGIAIWIVREITVCEGVDKIEALERVAELILNVGVVGAIATIITAIIARYGAREATRNLGAKTLDKER